MKRIKQTTIAIIAVMCILCISCIEDGFTTSSNDLLEFSSDTIAFDTIFTELGTPTKKFIVYNRHDKMINISSIKIAGESNGKFYLNVDGVRGESFSNVEIRAKDSIYVFVEAYIDPTDRDNPIEYTDKMDFVTNGVQQRVTVTAWGQDVTRLYSPVITEDTHLTAQKPYVIFDTLRVAKDVKLTLDPGTTLYFHDKAAMVVEGQMEAMGTQDAPITMRGDRLDHVVGGIGYDIMSGQWGGVRFSADSYGNEMQYVNMRGSSMGVTIDSTNVERMKLHLFNSVLHNSSSSVLSAKHAWVEAEGTEFSDAKNSVVDLVGGKIRFAQCTIANYYLFSVIGGTLLNVDYINSADMENGVPVMDAKFDNCVMYGNTGDINAGDLSGTNVYLRNCLLKSKGEDDSNFIGCKWGGDPKFYTVREKYVFDYRLRNESDAIAIGDRSLCPANATIDRYGVDRLMRDGIDIGAYTWVMSDEEK